MASEMRKRLLIESNGLRWICVVHQPTHSNKHLVEISHDYYEQFFLNQRYNPLYFVDITFFWKRVMHLHCASGGWNKLDALWTNGKKLLKQIQAWLMKKQQYTHQYLETIRWIATAAVCLFLLFNLNTINCTLNW